MSRHVIIIRGPLDRRRAASFIQNCDEGTMVEFKASRRTLDQNSKLWAMLSDISRQVDWYGQKLTAPDWKDVFSAALRRARVVPGLDAGTFVPLGMRTSDMTKAEFSDLLELVAAFAAERGVVFGDEARAA